MASSGVDVYTTIAMAAGALYGPKHGGANEAVIVCLKLLVPRIMCIASSLKSSTEEESALWFWPSSLQELRPTCQDRQEDSLRNLRIAR